MPLSSRSTTPTPLALIPPGIASHNSQKSVSTTTSSTVTATSPQNITAGDDVSRSSSTDDFFRSGIKLEQAGRMSPTLRKAPSSNMIDGANSSRYTADSNSSLSRVSFFDNPQAELEALSHQLLVEVKVKDGAENMLRLYPSRNGREDLRKEVVKALEAANTRIAGLETRILELRRLMQASSINDVISQDESFSDEDSRSAVNSALEALRSLSELMNESTSSGTSFARQDQKIEILNGLIQIMQRNERVRWQIPIAAIEDHLLPQLDDRSSSNLRAAVYRTLRYFQLPTGDVVKLIDLGLELFLIRTLARSANFELEKSEALLAVRGWIPTVVTASQLPPSIIRAVVSIVENGEDHLRLLALEVLAEVAVYNPALLTSAEGLRALLHTLIEGPFELSPAIAMALLPVMDKPKTRHHLRSGLDIELVVSTFAIANAKSTTVYDARLRTCAGIVGSYLKSWTGLLYLCMNEKQAIRSFIGGIDSPSAACRAAVLASLYDVFRIPEPELDNSGKRRVRSSIATVRAQAKLPSVPKTGRIEVRPRHNIQDHYLGLVLVVLIDAGLIVTLFAARDRSSEFVYKAATLVGQLIALSNRVLPVRYAATWQSLPELFGLAADFDDSIGRLFATESLASIDKSARQIADRQTLQIAIRSARDRANSLEDSLYRGQRHVEVSKIRLAMQIDDLTFKTLLLESQVLIQKDYSKWDYNAIMTAVEGPLLNPARMTEAVKGTRFVRRIITFFYPSERLYSQLENSLSNTKWTRLGCLLLTTLLSSADGLGFLKQDIFLRQIADALSLLDPLHHHHHHQQPQPVSEGIFSERNFARTVSSGYIEMIGTMTKHPEGRIMLEKAKIFTLLYRITDLKGREDIITACIEHLDYEADGHSRIILSKALQSGYKHVRLFATKHLANIVESTASSKVWIIQLLITQLYDISSEVCDCAAGMLFRMCEQQDILEAAVEMRPTLDHLGPAGAPLLFRFLSSSVGVSYLHEIEYIEREMDRWYNDFNDLYAIQLEVKLAERLLTPLDSDGDIGDVDSFDGTLPPHFYGELVKTEEGCLILQQKGHFADFANFIHDHGLEDEDADILSKLKSTIWAVAHIGAVDAGLSFLSAAGTIDDLVQVALDSEVLSVRGTCFYALGLLASSVEGADLLEAAGWISSNSAVGVPLGFCLPDNISEFLSITPWEVLRVSKPPQLELAPPMQQSERDALAALNNLSNNLLNRQTSKTIARLKQQHPGIFRSPTMFYRALHLLRNCHFRASVRTYILDLFNFPLDAASVQKLEGVGRTLKARIPPNTAELQETQRQSMTFNPMLRLDSDSESDESDSSQEEQVAGDKEKLPVEVLEPMVVMRGFL